MSDFWVQRVGETLVPDGTESVVEFAKFPFGKSIHVTAKQPRNTGHHKLYWTLCHRIAESIGAEPENVSDLFKIATGHCVIIRSKSYGDLRLPKSISFAKMDQSQFSEFFERCIAVMYETWKIDPAMVSDLLVPQLASELKPHIAA